jgi:hypothetical protein
MEKFNADYLNSNLQRTLDTILSYQSGIGYELKAYGVLFKDMIDSVTGKIHVTLDYPYENMFDTNTGFVDISLIPKIDTLKFGISDGRLQVQTAPLTPFMMSHGVSNPAPIYYGNSAYNVFDGVVVGTYIMGNTKSTIDLEFDFTAAPNLEDAIFGISNNGHGEYVEFDLVYPYTSPYNNNIPFTKNVIPRLRRVEFLYN